MADLRNKNVIIIKGFLFLVLGVFSALLILLDSPKFSTLFLMAVAIWAFCRSYYFAFYVIEKYADDEYKFSGLYSFVEYWLSEQRVVKNK